MYRMQLVEYSKILIEEEKFMNSNFKDNLKRIRKENNLSQEDLAELLGVSRQAVSKWESGIAYPEMDKILTICEKFNLNIDDLLNKDIKEVKSTEESKLKINKYVNDFLKFITDGINLFTSMNFKTKLKFIIEQLIIILVLAFILVGIFNLTNNLLYDILRYLPNKISFIITSIFYSLYFLLAFIISIIILVHLFKERYLNYFKGITKNIQENIEIKEDKAKIIIRNPKDSDYKFLSILVKLFIGIIKFFALFIVILLLISLSTLVFSFIISFKLIKTGLFFISLLIILLSFIVININLLTLVLNFIFTRIINKKIIIISTITSVITLGIGISLLAISILNFKVVFNDSLLITNSTYYEMKDDLFFDTLDTNKDVIEYVEEDIKNVRLEYTINKAYQLNTGSINKNAVNIWTEVKNPISTINYVINSLNELKIVSFDPSIKSIKIYASKKNIEIMKNNRSEFQKLYNKYFDQQDIINELEEQLDYYTNMAQEYKYQINELEDNLKECENLTNQG